MPGYFDLPPGDWATLRRLLDEALDLAEAARETWLGQLDASFDAFKPRLRALLAQEARGVGALPLDTLPRVDVADPAAGAADDGRPQPGDAVGPYRLIRLLGEGGMGEVWLAERTDMLQRRPVALKLPRLVTGRARLAERLAREREILAALDHPHIARLYDAGVTADGQPYLALEHVEGERIDAWCARQALDVPARLRLFVQVAQAVAHAHAHLVVHRDLKPSNILVNPAGEAKLLDFGIAKLLEDGHAEETELTRLAGRALTPHYASPEQILGQPVGTAADIYALGVVLFELLAGSHPYRIKRDSRAALEEAIVAAEIRQPSEAVTDAGLKRRLRGDLDTIVLKALKKAPAERYGTVQALIEDVERHLDSRPVRARPDGRLYRLRKFVARNRLAVGAAAGVLLAVLAGAAVSLWHAQVARAEQRRAEQVKAFVASIFAEANPYRSEAVALTADDLLRQAERKLAGQIDTSPATRVELLNTLGWSFIGLHRIDDAERLAGQALDESRRHLPADAPSALAARVLWTSVLRFRGRTAQLQAELQTLLPALRRAGARVLPELQAALANRAHGAIDGGRYAEAVEAARESLELARRLHGDRHPETATQAVLMAVALRFDGRGDESVRAGEQAMRLAAQAFADLPHHPLPAEARMVYALALTGVGEFRRAADELRAARDEAVQRLGPDNHTVAYYEGSLAPLQLELGEPHAALETTGRAMRLLGSQVDRGSTTFATVLYHRGRARLAMRQPQAALDDLREAAATLAGTVGPEHQRTLDAVAAHTRALAGAGRIAEARALADGLAARAAAASDPLKLRVLEALASVDRMQGQTAMIEQALATLSPPASPDRRSQGAAARTATAVGLAYLEAGRPDVAANWLRDADRWHRAAGTQASADTMETALALGRLALANDRAAEALPLLDAADRYWLESDADGRWAGEAAYWLSRAHAQLGRRSEAAAALARAREPLARSAWPLDAELLRLVRLN